MLHLLLLTINLINSVLNESRIYYVNTLNVLYCPSATETNSFVLNKCFLTECKWKEEKISMLLISCNDYKETWCLSFDSEGNYTDEYCKNVKEVF